MASINTPESAAATEAAPDIDEQVLALLMARKGEWESIAERSQVVSYSWISKFANGHIPGPKVDTLKNLRAWLLANPAPQLVSAPTSQDVSSSFPGATSRPPA